LNYKDPEQPDESRADSLCYLYQKLSERFPLVSFFGTFDYRDFENHSRLTNLIDIQNIGTELVHPLDRTESGWCASGPLRALPRSRPFRAHSL
jgi:enolase